MLFSRHHGALRVWIIKVLHDYGLTQEIVVPAFDKSHPTKHLLRNSQNGSQYEEKRDRQTKRGYFAFSNSFFLSVYISEDKIQGQGMLRDPLSLQIRCDNFPDLNLRSINDPSFIGLSEASLSGVKQIESIKYVQMTNHTFFVQIPLQVQVESCEWRKSVGHVSCSDRRLASILINFGFKSLRDHQRLRNLVSIIRTEMTVTNTVSNDKPARMFTWSEIGKHKSANDCWVVVKGKVYDVSGFVSEHPGGRLILNGAGRDATPLVMSYHPLYVQNLIKKFEIGQVQGYKPYYQWDSEFYTTLKK